MLFKLPFVVESPLKLHSESVCLFAWRFVRIASRVFSWYRWRLHCLFGLSSWRFDRTLVGLIWIISVINYEGDRLKKSDSFDSILESVNQKYWVPESCVESLESGIGMESGIIKFMTPSVWFRLKFSLID
jgi:hypothetical protein